MTDHFEERYESLNSEQKKAVDTIEGPLLVVAGPGSGKTELLSLRVTNILRRVDIRPGNILCLTFTDNASINMRSRLESLIGPEAYKVSIHTFHSFGTMIMNNYREYFFGGASFSPADEITGLDMLNTIFEALPFEDPLRSTHPEKGFVYLQDARSKISEIKRAGLTPDEFESILNENASFFETIQKVVDETARERISMKAVPLYQSLLNVFEKNAGQSTGYYRSVGEALAISLKAALMETELSGKTSVLSAWKSTYIGKEDSIYILKSALNQEKMHSLAKIYHSYSEALYTQGYFDFDDMLLEVIKAIHSNEALRYELTEKYQYILIDEFQDTNDAQMRLVLEITNADVHEGRPNVMVVGDDDQAVYRFQGADVSNILDFKRHFRDPEVIVLLKNYRSTQAILDSAREIILQGVDRLENCLPEIEKKLEAANSSLEVGGIQHAVLPSVAHEYTYLSKEISKLLKEGREPSSIAVIGRDHKHLEACVAHLHHAKIPVRYERQLNVLRQQHVAELITIATYIDSLSKETHPRDDLLPEILSYPFWGIDRLAIWDISVKAGEERKQWITVMRESTDKKIQNIAEFFIRLKQHALFEPAEIILDYIIGSSIPLLTETEDDDEIVETKPLFDDFISPFRNYYFGRDVFQERKAEYISFLSSLRVFIQALREYKLGTQIRITDLVEFVRVHESHGRLVADTSPFVSAPNAVSVLTAHKAKGLEWDTVFVINSVDDVWGKKKFSGLLRFPENLPIAPAGENDDDFIRLFYVAVTRARHTLYLTGYDKSEKGVDVSKLRFLNQNTEETAALEVPESYDVLRASLSAYHSLPASTDEGAMLRGLVENYQLSVTHLNNFLNVARGGPQAFFEQNLLRFPQAKTPSGAYGTAMHATVEEMHRKLKLSGTLPSTAHLLEYFEARLSRERMPMREFDIYLERGKKSVEAYRELKKDSFKSSDLIEVSFKHQGVFIDGAHLTGAIDKLQVSGSAICVCDFKTGKAFSEWKTTSPNDKIKLHNYRRQLIFYKILIENSKDYGRYMVGKGTLEFLEPEKGQIVDLKADISDEETERVIKLIVSVCKKIQNLDFPDVSIYPDSLDGILNFEDHLLTN